MGKVALSDSEDEGTVMTQMQRPSMFSSMKKEHMTLPLYILGILFFFVLSSQQLILENIGKAMGSLGGNFIMALVMTGLAYVLEASIQSHLNT